MMNFFEKKETKQNTLLDKMSLIDVKYVEAAQYLTVGAVHRNRKRLKFAAAAAALLVIGVFIFASRPHAEVIADEFRNFRMTFSDGNVHLEMKMQPHSVRSLSPEQLEKEYHTLGEVEELLGVDLLQSTKAVETARPYITLERNYDWIVIYHPGYYTCNLFVNPTYTGGGELYHVTGDNAFKIRYEAFFLTDSGDSLFTIWNHTYEYSRLVKTYTTAHGFDAQIFIDNDNYNAVIFYDNVYYTFAMERYRSHTGGGWKFPLYETALEEFLDTLE